MEIFLTNVFGRSIKFFVDETWSVEELEINYAKELETSSNDWYLNFNGKFLQHHQLLGYYNIMNGSVIHVTYRHAHRFIHPVELRIIYMDSKVEGKRKRNSDHEENKSLLMYAEANWSIRRVKEKFGHLRDIKELKHYNLSAHGHCLVEKYTLADYNILNDATLHFTLSKGKFSFKQYLSKYFIKTT